MRLILIIIAALAMYNLSGSEAFADFYAYTDDEGVVHFTNVPTSSKYKWVMREKKNYSLEDSGAISTIRRDISSFDNIIFNTSLRYGVDPTLVKAIVKAESDFDTRAVSHKGAKGLMQLMPETARLMGVKNIHDPEENVEGGIRYLSKLLKMFNFEIPLAVAAYNAGENAVLKYGNIPPFSETQNYVKKVMHYHRLYSDSGH